MYSERLVTISLPTGASFASKQYYAASVNSSGQAILATAAKNMIGVIQNTPDNSSDLTATLAVSGITKMAISGSITCGAQVQIASGGTGVVLSSGTAIGVALETGASGDIISVLIQPNNGALS